MLGQYASVVIAFIKILEEIVTNSYKDQIKTVKM